LVVVWLPAQLRQSLRRPVPREGPGIAGFLMCQQAVDADGVVEAHEYRRHFTLAAGQRRIEGAQPPGRFL
jgi:uncharacterized tellurite resistance protein B-like protein